MPLGWQFVDPGVDLLARGSDAEDGFDDDWAGGGALPMGPVPLLEFVESGHTVDCAPGMSEGFAHELVEAAARGDVTLLQRILVSKLAKGGADAASGGRSALHAAVEREQMMAAEAIIEAGAAVKSSAICCALVAGVEQCRRLLAAVQKYDANAQLDGMVHVVAPGEGSGRQHSPLGLACAAGDEPCTILLLRAAADPNALADGVRGRTALHIAAGVGSVGCVQALLEAGASTTIAAVTGRGLEPVDAPAEPCLRLTTAPPPRLDRAAALRLLQVDSPLPQSSLEHQTDSRAEAEPEADHMSLELALKNAGCPVDPGSQMDPEQTSLEAQAAADTAAAALLQEVADEERRSQQRRDRKRSKKKRAKLRRQMDSDQGETESTSSYTQGGDDSGSQADGEIVAEATVGNIIETVHAGGGRAQLTPANSDEELPECFPGSQQSTRVEAEGNFFLRDLTALRTNLAAAEARANAYEKECVELRKQLGQLKGATGGSDIHHADSGEIQMERGIGLPGTPPRRPGSHLRAGESSSAASVPTSPDGSCASPTSTSSLSDDTSSSAVNHGFASANTSSELQLPGEEIEIARAIIRAQYQAMDEAGLRYFIASFGSVPLGISDRLGINFGKDGATWPVVAEVTPGSLADSIRPPLVGARLHSIAGKDGKSVHVSGLSLEDGLSLVHAVGRPLLLTFERADQSAATGQQSASGAARVLDGERCPSPELLEFEGAVGDPSGAKEELDLDDETEEEEYQDAEEHLGPYPAARSDDVDDSTDGAAGEVGDANEQDNTVLGEAVREIRVLLNTWLQHVNITVGSSGTTTHGNQAAPIAHIYVYGSCLLFGDVVEDDSDIDLLVVAPSIVDRHLHFFGPPTAVETSVRDESGSENGLGSDRTEEEPQTLAPDKSVLAQLLAADRRVCELAAVRDAYVPCLRFKFNGRAIDLTLATPGLKSPLPGEAAQSRGCGWSSDLPAGLMNEAVLQSLRSARSFAHLIILACFAELVDCCMHCVECSSLGDAATLRSLNAVRVAHAILGSVPNRKTFLGVLRLVKAWAKARGVYGKALGYFGGISWALLTAAACQRLPYNAAPEAILQNFFVLWSTWPWPQPVALQGYHQKQPQQSLPRPIGPVSSSSSLGGYKF